MTRRNPDRLAPRTECCNQQGRQPQQVHERRVPSRSELDRADKTLLHQGTIYKADVYVVDQGGGPMVIKDFAGKPWWSRAIGRIQISHEVNAYQWLGPMPGIPTLYGRVDPFALAIEKIDGVRIVEADNRFTGRRAHLRGLREIAGRFLAAGFFHLDIRARRNVMVQPDGQVATIDLAGAFWVPPGTLRYRLFRPCLARYYRTVLFKWKKLLTLGRSFLDERSALEKITTYLRKPHHWLRYRRRKRERNRP